MKKAALLLVGAAAAGGAAWYLWHHNRGVLTPKRQILFLEAMNTRLEPAQFRQLAAAYKRVGLPDQAAALEGRAALAEAPPDVKDARKKVLVEALSSADPAHVESIAVEFDKIYALGSAERLRRYAAGLKAGLPAGHVPVTADFAGEGSSFGGRRKRRRKAAALAAAAAAQAKNDLAQDNTPDPSQDSTPSARPGDAGVGDAGASPNPPPSGGDDLANDPELNAGWEY